MRAVVYCRCSTEEERQVDALKKQVIEAKACVEDMGWKLVDSYVESKSGTTSKGRREYLRLYADLLDDRFDVIVIKSQDRLMRNTKDWYLFLDRMQSQGKKLYLYIERKFFTTEDSLITGIKAILAEEFSRELSKKIVNAHRYRQKNGTNAIITNSTFGFIKNADGSVVVDESCREAVVKMYRYVCEYGGRVTACLLEAEGIRSKKGKVMNEHSILRIIKNPINKGICVMNKTHFDFDTKKTVKNPESEWVYVAGLVPAIVDEDLWNRANEAISKRAVTRNVSGSYPRGSNPGKYVLSGKLICGKCGKPYYRSWRRVCSDHEKVINEWKCSEYVARGRLSQNRRESLRKIEQDASHGCDNVHIEEELVYECLDKVNALYFHSDGTDKASIINRTLEVLELALEKDKNGDKANRIRDEQHVILRKKELLLEKLLDEVISDHDYQSQNQKLEIKLEELRAEEKQLSQQLNEKKELKSRLQSIRDKLEHGGYERALTGQMLSYIHSIIVHEWQLEIRFDTLLMVGITSANFIKNNTIGNDRYYSVFIDYPFSPNTEKGRFLDRLKIMDCLKADPTLTAKTIAEKMNRSQHMIWNRFEELKKQGYIRFNGKGGVGNWEIIKELEDARVRVVDDT